MGPGKLPGNSPLVRELRVGETIKVGDYWYFNDHWRLMTGPCGYDPGCCTDKTVCQHDTMRYARLRIKPQP